MRAEEGQGFCYSSEYSAISKMNSKASKPEMGRSLALMGTVSSVVQNQCSEDMVFVVTLSKPPLAT